MKRSLLVAFAALASATTLNAATPPVPADISLVEENGVLVPRSSESSLPLYTFDRDRAGRPTCSGACAQRWPALIATPHSTPIGEWTMISLGAGAAQWAFRGRPVYTHAGDRPGKATGDGIDGVWHLLPPFPRD